MHILVSAEVSLDKVRSALEKLPSKGALIKKSGDPRIAVSISLRTSSKEVRRARLAENVLKERIRAFGYRVWSRDEAKRMDRQRAKQAVLGGDVVAAASIAGEEPADFTIRGEVEIGKVTQTWRFSHITRTQFIIRSWTIRCMDNRTGEEIYFNNKTPNKAWSSESRAIQEIGALIADEFNQAFFERHITRGYATYQLMVTGLPSYDAGLLLKRELIGLPAILRVDFRKFDAHGMSLFEVDVVGDPQEAAALINSAVIKPLNAKLGGEVFAIESVDRQVIRIGYRTMFDPEVLTAKMREQPPASLALAPLARLQEIARSDEAWKKIEAINPKARSRGLNPGGTAEAVEAF